MDRFLGRRRLLALAIAWVVVAPVFTPARAATGTVTERGTEFAPHQIDVKTGDTVVWVYESGPNNDGHAVKFDNGPDLSPNCTRGLLGGLTGCQDRTNPNVQRTFTASGTFPYRCKIHADQGMVGVVVVSAVSTTSSTAVATSSTLARATTTSSTVRGSTSSTTATTRQLSTSSTLIKSTTTTADTTSVLLPGDAPAFPGDDADSAAGQSGSGGGNDSGTVVLIVGLLLAVAVGGGLLLWRLRPGRT